MTELKNRKVVVALVVVFGVGLLCTAFLTLRGGCAAAAFCCLLLLPLAVGKISKLSDRK